MKSKMVIEYILTTVYGIVGRGRRDFSVTDCWPLRHTTIRCHIITDKDENILT